MLSTGFEERPCREVWIVCWPTRAFWAAVLTTPTPRRPYPRIPCQQYPLLLTLIGIEIVRQRGFEKYLNTFCGQYCFEIWRSIPAQSRAGSVSVLSGKGSLAALKQQLWFDAQESLFWGGCLSEASASSGVRTSL